MAILGSWSAMRKYLENEMLAESLNGRVRYNCTRYIGMDGTKLFEIYVDNKLIKRFSWETLNNYFIESRLKTNQTPIGECEYWDEYWEFLNSTPMTARTEYTDKEFAEALEQYRNQKISDSINSENVIVRMFAVLDRRIGKRTLTNIKNKIDEQPDWLKPIYDLRLTAENIISR